jgi:3-hydroxymyristoyl/3-hydroxydecanoyl-(acyl carrier protein) dehydratase
VYSFWQPSRKRPLGASASLAVADFLTPAQPGTSLKIESQVTTPGVFMYHCANGAMTDQHIKMSISGATIVYPRAADVTFAPAKELVVVQGSNHQIGGDCW